MVTIYYDNANPFSGVSPTPFVGKSVEMLQFGERWGELETYTLRGQLTGECTTYEDLLNKQQKLISGFRKDFQKFELYDGTGKIFDRDYVKITNIGFEASNYMSLVPYTITLQAYPSGFFSGQYGILDPKDELAYAENRDGVLNINHTISARGFNTSAGSSNALSNARQWVQGRQGFSSQVLPAFINYSNQPVCLTTKSENINRLAGTYEIRETYTADLLLGGTSLLRYTVEYSTNINDGITIMAVRGDIVGCKDGTITDVRNRYAAFDAYAEALKYFNKLTGRTDLNPTPVSKGITESTTQLRIGFSYVFNDDLSPQTTFDYRVSFSYDYENDIISASIEGKVLSRAPIATRWATIVEFASHIDLYSLLLPLYRDYANSLGITYPLNPTAQQYSRTENKFNFELGLSASFDNRALPPPGLNSWNYTITVTPALHQYADVPCLDGGNKYVTFDLGFATRQVVSVAGDGVSSTGGTPSSTILGLVTSYANQYGNGPKRNLDAQKVTESTDSYGKASATVQISAEAPEFTF